MNCGRRNHLLTPLGETNASAAAIVGAETNQTHTMGAITIQKTNVVFGIPDEIKPLEGFPAGRVRLRLRSKEFAIAFVKTNCGIRSFFLVEKEDKWRPYIERGRNEILLFAKIANEAKSDGSSSCYYCGSLCHDDDPCPNRTADAERFETSGKALYPNTTSAKVSSEIGNMVHAFSDDERREQVRAIARQVVGLEKRIEELVAALRKTPHDSECHPSEGIHTDRCTEVKALLARFSK